MATTSQVVHFLADLSQVLLVFGVYLTYRQLTLATKDIRFRSKREAGTFAISEARAFAEVVIPLHTELIKILGGLTGAPNKLEKFVPLEIHPAHHAKYHERVAQMQKHFDTQIKITNLANKIEEIALALNKGIADEEVLFDSVATVYCEIIENLYFFYCHCRRANVPNAGIIPLYENTIRLYVRWKTRISSLELEADGRRISVQLREARRKSSPVNPIGTV